MRALTPFELRRRPDQTTYRINQMHRDQVSSHSQHTITSADGTQKIILGNQPDGSFGIKLYNVLGDRLELRREY